MKQLFQINPAAIRENRQGASRIALAVIVLILIVSGIGLFAYFSNRYPALRPADGSDDSDSKTILCNPGDLEAKLSLEGAAGNIYGSMSITNNGSRPCSIAGNRYPRLDYDTETAKNISVVNEGLPSVREFRLEPGASVYSKIHMPNGPQCSSEIKTVAVKISYEIAPQTEIVFRDNRGRQEFTVAACSASADITQIEITNLSDQSLP